MRIRRGVDEIFDENSLEALEALGVLEVLEVLDPAKIR